MELVMIIYTNLICKHTNGLNYLRLRYDKFCLKCIRMALKLEMIIPSYGGVTRKEKQL